MAVAEIALIVVAFGAMAVVFGVQERAEERRILAWAEDTLARLAGAAGTVEVAAAGDTRVGDITAAADTAAGDIAAAADTAASDPAASDTSPEAPAPPPRELVDAA